jgi:hypothetical protein
MFLTGVAIFMFEFDILLSPCGLFLLEDPPCGLFLCPGNLRLHLPRPPPELFHNLL